MLIFRKMGPLRNLDTAFQGEIDRLTDLISDLMEAKSCSEKIARLNETREVQRFFGIVSPLRTLLGELPEEYEYVTKAVFAIGQGERIFSSPPDISNPIPHYRIPMVETPHS